MRSASALHPLARLSFLWQSLFVGLLLAAASAHADVYGDVERALRNGQLERARQLSSAHLRLTPQDPQMRLLVSRLLQAEGQNTAAQETLQSLTLEYPELPEPHNNLAVLLASQGRFQEALESLQRALRARPDYALALENLGDVHLHLALEAYRNAAQNASPPRSLQHKLITLAPLLAR